MLGTTASTEPTARAGTAPRPSMAPIRSASFTSPMPIPFGEMSAATNRNARGAERSEQPLGAGVDERVPDEHDRRRRQDDAVRDDAALEIRHRDGDENDRRERGQHAEAAEPVHGEASGDQGGGHQSRGVAEIAAAQPARRLTLRLLAVLRVDGGTGHVGRAFCHAAALGSARRASADSARTGRRARPRARPGWRSSPRTTDSTTGQTAGRRTIASASRG